MKRVSPSWRTTWKPTGVSSNLFFLFCILPTMMSFLFVTSSEKALLPIPEVTSSNGMLNVDFTVAPYSKVALPSQGPTPALFYEDKLTYPAPILRALPGDTVLIRVKSKLVGNVKGGRDDATGLNVHGLRLVNGIASRLAGPQMAIHTFKLSHDHAPGLHWYRVGGDLDFAGAFYVLSPDASPTSPTPTLLMFQYQGSSKTLPGALESGEAYLVDGRRGADLSLHAGESRMLDLAHAAGPHLLEIEAEAGCGLRLLAMDGVDLNEPREVSFVGLIARQRARVLLTCTTPGESGLVTWPSPFRQAIVPYSQRWDQRFLTITVNKAPFSRLPRLPIPSPSASSWYLRDLQGRDGPLSSCSLSLLPCPSSTSCPGGRQICPLASPAGGKSTSPTLRELFITQASGSPSASVRLRPAQPFQIVGYTPPEGSGHGTANIYLQHFGQYGDWRDVLPPLPGTFRLRYQATSDDHSQPEIVHEGFDAAEEGEVEQPSHYERGNLPYPVPIRPQAAQVIPPVLASAEALTPPSSSSSNSIVNNAAEEKSNKEINKPRRSFWSFPGHKSASHKIEPRAVLLVQMTVADHSQNASWVTHALEQYLGAYLLSKAAYHLSYDEHRSLAVIPVQMPRRFLPAAAACSQRDMPIWATAINLNLRNASSIYPVINKLHALLAEEVPDAMPQLCSLNVTLLHGYTGSSAMDSTAPSSSSSSPSSIKAPPTIIALFAFCGGAGIILIALFIYRQVSIPTGPRPSRRATQTHDPTSIETQIAELDDSSSSMGIKSTALRHNSRSRNNSLTGISAHILPPPRIPHHHHHHNGGSRPSLPTTASAHQQQHHYRSSSSLPTDLAGVSHARSASLPHAGFLLPRTKSSERTNQS